MKKVITTILFVILALVLLILGFLGVVATTPWGQQFVTDQVNSYLSKKIKTPFSIGHIRYSLPDWIELEDVYFNTPKGDTLLRGRRMRVDIDMLGLLNNRVAINQIELEHIKLNVTRTLPDTAFNFQFLLDAFNTAKPENPELAQAPDTTATPLDINLKSVMLKDVRIGYHDDVAGAEVNAYVDSLRANFDKVNVTKSQYYLTDVTIDGLDTKARIYQGLLTPASPPTNPNDTLDLGLGKWMINRAKWDVQVATADFATKGQVGRLAMESDYLYLNGEKVGIKSLQLANADIAAILTKPTARPKPIPVTTNQPQQTTSPGWQAQIGQLLLANNRIRYDDQTQPHQRKGMDYAHLDIQGLGLTGRNIAYSPSRSAAQIRQGRFKEKSGFVLNRLDGDVIYSDTTVSLNKLFVQAGKTLLRDRLVLHYDSIGQLSRPREAGRVKVLVNLRQSQLAVADVLQLAPFLADTPPFAGNTTAIIRANALATGTLASLNLPVFELAMLGGTKIRAKGRLTNVTDPNRLGVDVQVQEATTRRDDIRKLVPKGTLPDSIAFPPDIRLTGRISGQANNLNLDSRVQTEWGTAQFKGNLANFVTGKGQTYKGTLALDKFQAGKWLMNPKQYGNITARAQFDGRGLDVKTMQTAFRVNVQEAGLNGYTYQNLNAQGRLSGGTLDLKANTNDPNAKLTIDTRVGLTTAYPSIVGKTTIQELNLDKLKLYDQPLTLRGDLDLNFTSTDPTKPVGTLRARNATVLLNGQSYPIDSLYLKADTDGPRKIIAAQAPFAQLNLSGLFEYTRLYDIVAGEISKYFALPQLAYKTVQPPYNFLVSGKVYQHPLLQAFVPALTKLDTIRLNAYLDNTRDTTLLATIKTGQVVYDTTLVRGSSFSIQAANSVLALNGQVAGVQVSGMDIGPTSLTGLAANNQMRFGIATKDSVGKDQNALAGRLTLVNNNYRLQLDRNGLLTNYRPWTTADTTGFLQYGDAGVLAERFSIRSGNQTLSINSVDPVPNGPLRVTAQNLNLSDLAAIANQDTSLVGGRLNGDVVVKNYMTNLSFTGDVRVDSLAVMQKSIGNLTSKFANTDNQRISVDAALLGQTNDVRLDGFYNPASKNQPLDFRVDLRRLDARTIEAFSFGELRRAKGQLRGQFSINGSPAQPALDGAVMFDSVAFNVKQLNSTYRIDQERLVMAGSSIAFRNFAVRDTLNQTLTTDGTVTFKNLPDVAYDLRIKADKFLVLNAARKDNDYAYGNASVTANLHVKGTGSSPAIDGTVRLEDNSKVSVVLPDETMDANEAREIVTFIDHKDTLALAKYLTPKNKPDTTTRRLAFDQLTNSNISLNLEADEKSELTIIVDELNGDYLRARGNARLDVSLDAGGNVSVLGRYEVTEGEYSLTYQVLKRQFAIQKGSYILFTGDPLKADMNITAVYKTKADPVELIASEVSTQTRTLPQRLPFNVNLNLSENLSSPKITFDIVRATGENEDLTVASGAATDLRAVDEKLAQIRQDPSQMNKQVFALLVLGNFLSENSSNFFSSSGSGSGGLVNAEEIARNSVSKLLSQQLQKFASNVLKGFDVDFNLLSTSNYDASTTGGSRTDLNVGLSKSFLQGRLTVSVGRNFALENNTNVARNPAEVFDNVSLNYNLSRDGRYMLRGYRKNEFQIVYGYIIETGIGFNINVDYNTFAELFNRRKRADEEQ